MLAFLLAKKLSFVEKLYLKSEGLSLPLSSRQSVNKKFKNVAVI